VLVSNYIHYVDDLDAVAAARPVHRAYMKRLDEEGRLAAGGPFEDGTGALFVYRVDSVDEAGQIAADDPYTAAGVIKDHTLQPWHVVYADPTLLSAAE
jgi:uncharacterized protein YciI